MMSSYRLGHLAMLAFSLLVAGSFSLGTRIAHMMDPITMMAARFFISALVLGAFAFANGKMRLAHFHAPWRYAVLGGLFAVYFVLMFEGLKTAQPVSAAAVFTLTPILTGIFGYWFLRQITTSRMMIALIIGAAGAVWVIFRADLSSLMRFEIGRGEGIYFVGVIAHSVYTPLVRKLNRGEPALVFSFGMAIAGFVMLTAISLPDLIQTEWTALPPLFWAGLLYLAICASALTFFLLQFATLNLPSVKVMAYTYLTPSWVIGWELALGGNLPPPLVMFGIVATIVALLMLLKDQG